MTIVDDRRDLRWMEQALALAALGEGRTSPNPRVGCVVVRDDSVVGAGFHPAVGEPHAEWFALDRAGEAARGATLYVNLEPCAHHGRTPPCVDLIVRSGIRRVVASLVDPNPLVDGRGLARLREAGIEVRVGAAAREAEELNAAFLHWHRHGRPLVTLKAAPSLDGRLTASGGAARWITGRPARRLAHRLRMRHDAILVGAATVRRDDPLLTVRLPGVRAPRIRGVIAPSLDLRSSARIFTPAEDGSPPPRLFVGESGAEAARRAFAGAATVVAIPGRDGELDLLAVLRDLGGAGAQSVLVEGGGRTLGAFLTAGLADRVALFVASRLLGDHDTTPLVVAKGADDPGAAWRLVVTRRVPVGSDQLVEGIPVRGGGPVG